MRTLLNCRLALPLLSAYIDGELPAPEKRRLVDHLNDCSACAQHVADLKTLQTALGSESIYHHAPGTLRSRVAQSLAAGKSSSWFSQPVSLQAVAAIFLSIVLLGGIGGLGWWWINRPEPTLMELSLRGHDQAVTNHRLTELTSSDAQQVKQWLREKTGQDVVVKDLSALKFQLIGSRVESSTLGTIPVLVYAVGDKMVSLYLWPSQISQRGPVCDPSQPHYQFSSWCDAKRTYWAISEAPSEQLLEFTKGIRGIAGK